MTTRVLLDAAAFRYSLDLWTVHIDWLEKLTYFLVWFIYNKVAIVHDLEITVEMKCMPFRA